MQDDDAIRFCDGVEDRFLIERQDGAEVDHFNGNAVLRQFRRGIVGDVNHRAPRDDGEILAAAADVGLADRDDVVVGRQLFLDAAIQEFVLDKEHRIVITNGGLQQSLGVVRGTGRDDLQSRPIHEHGLGIQRMKRSAMRAAARRSAHDDRTRAPDAIPRGGGEVDEHVVRARDEVDELHLGDGPHSHQRRS